MITLLYIYIHIHIHLYNLPLRHVVFVSIVVSSLTWLSTAHFNKFALSMIGFGLPCHLPRLQLFVLVCSFYLLPICHCNYIPFIFICCHFSHHTHSIFMVLIKSEFGGTITPFFEPMFLLTIWWVRIMLTTYLKKGFDCYHFFTLHRK